MDQAELGRGIASARKRARVTQEQLAARIGLDRTAVTKIENGTRKIGSLELLAISEALSIDVSQILIPASQEGAHVFFRDAERAGLDDSASSFLSQFAKDYEFLEELAGHEQLPG